MIDPKIFNTVAQSAHFFSGLAIILTASRFGRGPVITLVLIAWILFTLAKEFVYDAKYETPEVRGNSTEDALVSILGAAVGCALLGLTGGF